MSGYFHWKEQTITDFSPENIRRLYDAGYVFTRRGKGIMHQTRSLRIDLSKFELTSENRRILRKTNDLRFTIYDLPYKNYTWHIAKIAKNFYDTKFGHGTFSANKIKELLTNKTKSNFTKLFAYTINNQQLAISNNFGYAICYENDKILHYSYPFYQLPATNYQLQPNLGMSMMLKAILYAKESDKKYIYLGSAQRPTDVYKLQFDGLEWFDGKIWKSDLKELKQSLNLKSQIPRIEASKHLKSKIKKIHFIGICGVAMSALAIAFKKAGWSVTGSDAGFFPPVSTNLEKHGVDFYPGWHPEQMIRNGVPDLVVVGNVASSTNPEWLYVEQHGLAHKSYPEVIAEYIVAPNSIVCAGTYGKTTTAALMTWILKENGFDPSYMFGGVPMNSIESAFFCAADSQPRTSPLPSPKRRGSFSVLEGDEYKTSRWDNRPKFVHYLPTHLLLTSVVWDHADVYPTEESYMQAFQQLFDAVPESGLRVLSEKATEIIATKKKSIVTYGQDTTNDYRFVNVAQTKDGIAFDIVHDNSTYHVQSQTLGEFMADNITGCFALAHKIGLGPTKIIKAIQSFKGIKRRLEKRYEGDITVFDDIAHSPSKAQAILTSLRSLYDGKIIAVFEPNTGNRQSTSIPFYKNAFAAADEIIIPRLTKIKTNPTDPNQPMNGAQLADVIKKTHHEVRYIGNDAELINFLLKKTKNGDIIVFLGSHGFRGMIDELVSSYFPSSVTSATTSFP